MTKNEISEITLITGASSGIGRELARVFAGRGHDVVLVARREDRLLELKAELERAHGVKVFVCQQDLAKPNAARAVFDYCTRQNLQIDILVNNAGFGDNGKFWQRDWQKQADMTQVNMVALMQLTHLFLPAMVERGWGRILNMSSVAAFVAGPEMSIYYASKAFVTSFSEAISEELKGTGVTVTALHPSPVATEFEKTADMTGSKMFNTTRLLDARDVARASYKALMQGKPLAYYSLFTKLVNLGTRLAPRRVSRKLARRVNEIEKG